MIVHYILLFFIYSFVGWVVETTANCIQSRRWVDRGFLLGPIIPVYGVGSVLLTLFLRQHIADPLVVIVMAIAICGVLEYVTSWVMERLFSARWWDYSHYKWNLNGRVCLGNLVLFALGGYMVIAIINPVLFGVFASAPENVLVVIAAALSALFVVDMAVSFSIVWEIKKETGKFALADNTDEITRRVRQKLMKKSSMYRRLVKAFPGLKVQPRKRGRKSKKKPGKLFG